MDITKLLKGIKGCSCGKSHACPIDYVDIAEGALSRLPEMCNEYNNILIVCDKNTYSACGKDVAELLGDKAYETLILKDQTDVVIPDETQIDVINAKITDNTDLIVGVGSGVINDLCKIAGV